MSSPRKFSPRKPRLEPIPGGRASERAPDDPIDELFSGRVKRAPRSRRDSRGKPPPQTLPEGLESLGDVYAAGRSVIRELEFKVKYAEQRIKDFCLRDYARRFAAAERRPDNVDYSGPRSRFKFVMTSRTTLTPEKVEALRSLRVPIERHTRVRGLRIDFAAIQRHGLEGPLKRALGELGVAKGVIEECFVPEVELKEGFYERLDGVVRESLGPDEELESKLLEVLATLAPASQVRNLEAVGLDARECFDLVNDAEIEADEDVA